MRANFAIVVGFFFALRIAAEKRRPSILVMIADDMRAFSPDERLHLPNIDYLASLGASFENAFAQQSLCAPSRNSFLTSRRPDTLHLYDFYSYWRTSVGNFTSLPQYFRENGYSTFSFGKVFHPGVSSGFTDDYPYSWSEPPYHPSTERYKNSKVCTDKTTGKPSNNLVCPVDVDFQPEKTLPDIQTTRAAIDKLKSLKNSQDKNPFLVMVGFHKPHIPLKFPQNILKHYHISNITLPEMPFKPPTMLDVAWNHWLDVRKRDDIRKLNISFPFGVMPDEWTLKIKQSYYGCLTYIDNLVGEILPHVDMENTIIVFTSDHGWSLGEHGEWAKYSNFDVALRVPLIIYDPKAAIRNKIHDNVVELVDLLPTLAELSGIVDFFPQCVDKKQSVLCTEGKSLIPILETSTDQAFYAFSQYPRSGLYPTRQPNSDEPKLKQIKIMGYTIRTNRFRYTEWVSFDSHTFSPNWNMTHARELYDHRIDPGENLNLADRSELKYIVSELSIALRRQK